MLDEDATRMIATCPQQVVRVVLVDFEGRHDQGEDMKRFIPQNPSLSNVSSEHTHCPLLQTLLAMTHTSLSRQGPLSRPLASDDINKLS